MSLVEAQAWGPDELLATEADRALAVGSFAPIVVAGVCRDGRFRRCGDALVGTHGREIRQQEADAVEDRRQRVALVTLGALAEAAGDTTLLRIDADEAAVDEVRALARLSLQPRVRIAARDSGRVCG